MLFREWKSEPLDEKKNPVIFWLVLIIIMILISALIVVIGNMLS
jgi:hypothetical protein